MPGASCKGDNPISHMVNLYLQNRDALCTLGLSMSYWDCFQQCVEAWKIHDWQARVERLINICLHYEAPSADKKAFNTIMRVIGNEEGQSMIANLLQGRFFENVDARSRPPNSFAAVLVAALHGSYSKRKEAIRRARSKFDRDMKAVVQQQQGNADSEFCLSNRDFGSRDGDDGDRKDCGSSGEITENMLHVATFLDFLTVSPSYEHCYQQCLNAWKIPDVRDRVKQLFAVVMNYEASQEEKNALTAMLPKCEGATKAEKMRYSQVCLTHLLEARLFKDDGVSSKPPASFAPVFAALIGESFLERKRGIRDACSAFIEDMKLLARKQKANVDSVVPNWDDFVCPGARDNLIGKKSKTRDRPTKGVITDDDGDGGDSHANSEADSSEPPGLDSTDDEGDDSYDDEGDGISSSAFQQRQQAAKHASAAPSGIKRGFFDSPTKPSHAEGQKGNKKNAMSRGGGGGGGGRQVKRTDEVSECDAARNVNDRYDDNGEDSCDDIPELVDPDESSSDGDEAHCTGTQPSGLKRGFFNAEGSSSSTAATFNTPSRTKARKEIPAKAAEAAQRQTVLGAEPSSQKEEGQAVEEAEVKPAQSRNKRQQTVPQPRYEFKRFESESIKEMQRKEAEQRRELRKKLGLETNPTPDSDPILGPCHLGKSCVRFSDGDGGQVRESHAERVFVRCSQGCEFYYHQSCWRKAWITSPEEDAGSTDKILGRHFRWTKPQVQQGRYPCFNEDCKGAVVYAQGPKKHVYVDTTARIKHTHGKGELFLFPNKGGGEAQGTRGEERGRRSKEGTDQGYCEEEEEEYGEKYRHCIEEDEDGSTVKEGDTTEAGAGAAESPGRKVEERDTKEENQDDDHSMPLSKEERRRAVAPSPQVAAFELPEDALLRPLLRDDDEDDDDLRVHRASKKDKNAPVPAVAEVLYDEDVQHGQGARSSHAEKRKKGGGGGGQKLHWAELVGGNASLYEHRRRAAEETRDEAHHQQQRITSDEHANLAQNHAIGGMDPMDGAPSAGTIVWTSSETGIPSVSDRFTVTSAAETTRLHLHHGPLPSSSGAYARASSSGACVHPSGGDGSSLTVMDFPPLGPLSASAGGSTGAGERLGSNKEANGALDDDDDEAFEESQRNKLGDAILTVLQGLRAELPTAVHCPSVLLENMDMKSLCYREYVAPTTFLAQYVGHECGTDAVSSIEVYLEAGAAVIDFTSLDAAQAALRLLTGRVLHGRQLVVSLMRTAMPRDEVERRAIALVASGGGVGGVRYDSQPQHRPSSVGRTTNVPTEVCGPSTRAHRAPYFASSYDRRQHQQDGMQREGGHSLLERSDSINASGRALAPTAPSFVPTGALPTSGPPDGRGLPTDYTTTWEAERRRRAEQEAADAELALRLQQQLIFEEERRVAEREEHDRRLAELIQGQAAGDSSPTTQRQASASGVVLGDRGAGNVRDDNSQQQRPLHRCHDHRYDHRHVAETSLDEPSRHDPQQAGTAMPSVELLSQLLPGYMPSLAQGAANAGFREAGRPPHPLPPQQHTSLVPFQQPQTRPSAPPQAFTTSHATRSSTSPSPYHPLAAHHHQLRQTAMAAARPVPDQTPDQSQPPSNRFQAAYRPPGLGGYRPPGVATVREQSLPDHMGKATGGAAFTPLLQAEPQQQPVQEQRAAEQAPMKTLKRPCVQCGAAEASHLWLPCGHFGHCDACLPDTAPGMDRSEQFGQCLLCDTPAYRYMRTYMT